MPIKVLDPSVVGRIAAGEVVERPSSVAKELIENAIDAGATSITVEIRDGGINYLRVTDNGCGIAPSQVALAFENHATSKIVKAEQLDDIRTLGFRGEALPSIAAVSHLEMTTREKNAASGVKLIIDGGVKKPVSEVGCPEGTTVIMRDLFFNVPVRRTFLKRPAYEGSLVNDLMARMILGNPGVSFRFINNSKTVYHSFGDGSLKHAVFAVYGSEAAEKMAIVDASCGSMRISGMIGTGELSKATRAHQSFFINGRSVRCALITQVLEQVCRGRVTIGTYPMCALTLSMPAAAVDVNVHPNKLEVRFRDEMGVRLSIENILSQAFAGESVLDFTQRPAEEVVHKVSVEKREIQTPSTVPSSDNASPKSSNAAASEKASNTLQKQTAVSCEPAISPAKQTDVHNAIQKPDAKQTKVSIEGVGATQKPTDVSSDIGKIAGFRAAKSSVMELREDIAAPVPTIDMAMKARQAQNTEPESKPEQLIIAEAAPSAMEASNEPVYRVIGTLFNTYILIELNDSLLMIDQHAAHERLMYEKFTARMESGETASQPLMVPVIIAISAKEMAIIEENRDALEKVGYQVEPFGERSISVRAVPFIMGHADVRPIFMDMLGSLDRIGSAAMEARADEIATMACKAAVKAGDKLTDSEISALINQMLATGAPPTCPHGRPVSRTLSKREIEKLFKRIQ